MNEENLISADTPILSREEVVAIVGEEEVAKIEEEAELLPSIEELEIVEETVEVVNEDLAE